MKIKYWQMIWSLREDDLTWKVGDEVRTSKSTTPIRHQLRLTILVSNKDEELQMKEQKFQATNNIILIQ